jgi:cell division protein FtsB
MSDDLVKRLRDLASQSIDGDLRGPALQAADRIEALEAERDALKAEVERLRDDLGGARNMIAFQEAQLKAYEEMAPPRDPDLLRKRLNEIKAMKEY